MDLYKVFDQTVREIKREVNKKVLKVPEIEQKVLEATSNEPWGPHGTLMSDIAQATRNYHEYQMIMAILWKRLNDTGKNWRHVYKALTVLEFLVAQGADRTIDELKEHSYQIQTLVDFQFVEPNGKDQGINVRKKAQTLVALINDKEKIREARAKAAANRDKYKGMASTGGRSASYGGGDRYGDDGDKYGSSRYGDRDRESERGYKDGDRYGGSERGYKEGERDRDSDQYGGRGGDRDRGDRYGREDRYDDEGYGSKGRDYDDDYDPRRSDRSVPKNRPPPSYEESYSDSGYQQPGDESRDGSVAAAVARAKGAPKGAGSQGSAAGPGKGTFFAGQAADEEFDDFDPRGRPAPPASTTGAVHPEGDFFAQAAPKSLGGVEDLFGDAAFQAAPAPVSNASNGDLFASGGFQAAPASVGLAPPPAYNAPMSAPPSNGGMDGGFGQFESAPAPAASAAGNSGGFGFDAFGGDGFSAFEAAKPAPVLNSGPSSNPLPTTSSNAFQQSPMPLMSGPASTGSNAGKKAYDFQPKSSIFADTLSTGLVDLNIKGPKDNPLASLGIDLTDTSLVRAQQAKAEQSPPTSVSMGKAMGLGTGMGVAGASVLAAPPQMMVPPMGGGMGGMGMGGGMGGMGMGPGMGMGMGMNPGMGMGMAPGMGMGMAPGMGMSGMGMNPGMGGMGMNPGFSPQMGMGGPQYPQGQYGAGGFR
eukprot:TRINITY_DN490_c0_g1_i2.p1 TRINITY_DN490_c0_g1~~TRINITY_DN490_c0_g1_i2.p1  ORF type:complete len:702 (+),score=194.87 TRINITY_DN490_c0_g1_i2:215-2320(+)